MCALLVPFGHVVRANLCRVAVSSLDLVGHCIGNGDADCCCFGVGRRLVHQCVKRCIANLNALQFCSGELGCGGAGGLEQFLLFPLLGSVDPDLELLPLDFQCSLLRSPRLLL